MNFENANTAPAESKKDLLENRVEGKFPLGSLQRSAELRIKIKEFEDTLAKNPEHPHKDSFAENLELFERALTQNEAEIYTKIAALPNEKQDSVRERYDQIMRHIILLRNIPTGSPIEHVQYLGKEEEKAMKELDELNTQLN